jgi:hypothetical protein
LLRIVRALIQVELLQKAAAEVLVVLWEVCLWLVGPVVAVEMLLVLLIQVAPGLLGKGIPAGIR